MYNYVIILTYESIFTKRYIPNWSEKVFDTCKTINIVPWTYVVSDLNSEKIVGPF